MPKKSRAAGFRRTRESMDYLMRPRGLVLGRRLDESENLGPMGREEDEDGKDVILG